MNNEQNVEGFNVSPAIAKPMLCAVISRIMIGVQIKNGFLDFAKTDFDKKIYSETEFKEVYPKSKQFGISAWSFKTLETAIERLNNL